MVLWLEYGFQFLFIYFWNRQNEGYDGVIVRAQLWLGLDRQIEKKLMY